MIIFKMIVPPQAWADRLRPLGDGGAVRVRTNAVHLLNGSCFGADLKARNGTVLGARTGGGLKALR